jgi:hypothetical protein
MSEQGQDSTAGRVGNSLADTTAAGPFKNPVPQWFKDLTRVVHFKTGMPDWPIASHGGTAFIVSLGGRPYAVTCAHVAKDFDWKNLIITDERCGQWEAVTSCVWRADKDRTTLSAAGSDVLDLAAVGFSDVIDVSFFKGAIFDLGAACPARTGDGLYTYGVLKERSIFEPSMMSPTFIDCGFVDAGPSPNDPSVRVAQTRVFPGQIQSLAGLSGAPVYNVRTETVCGMVVRAGLERVGAIEALTVRYVDIYDIVKFLECMVSGREWAFYQKPIAVDAEVEKPLSRF